MSTNNRDPIARRRILYIENRLDRLMSILSQQQTDLYSLLSAPNLTCTCTKCNIYLNDTFICTDTSCPHGLDIDVEKEV